MRIGTLAQKDFNKNMVLISSPLANQHIGHRTPVYLQCFCVKTVEKDIYILHPDRVPVNINVSITNKNTSTVLEMLKFLISKKPLDYVKVW